MSLNSAAQKVNSTSQGTRPRSNSVIKLMPSHNTPVQQHSKRSLSVSEGSLSKLSETEAVDFMASELNWANKFEDFFIGKPIGYGASAVVYEAAYKPLRKRVAIKTIDLDMFGRNQIEELRRETTLMALSKHPNILRVYGSFVNGSKLHIVTPYLSAGSFLDIIKCYFPDGFNEISIATILRQALHGLVYLHKNGHIHRDVKAGNLLMDEEGSVLLADFGVSASLTDARDVRKTFVGTPCWMAPEVMEQSGYNCKADIWSFGITSIELATGHAPYAKFPPQKVLKMILSNDPPTLERDQTKHKFSKTFKDMIDSCLQKDPAKRPTAEKLLMHPFFKQSKKKDYLVKSIIQNITLLDQRQSKKIPTKDIPTQQTEQWDFDDPPHSDIKKSPTPIIEQRTTKVQFKDCAHVNRPTEHTIDLQPPKKHISFVETVIKDSSSSARPLITPPTKSPTASNSYFPDTLSKKSRFVIEEETTKEVEIKKGRFSVNHTPTRSTEMVRVDSQEHAKSKPTDTPPLSATPPECRRKGRFELTGGSNTPSDVHLFESPQLAMACQSPVLSPHNSISSGQRVLDLSIPSTVVNQIECLVKQSEIQSHFLKELLTAQGTRTIASSETKRHADENPQSVSNIKSAMEHLQRLLEASDQEKEKLARENEALKREIEMLRKQQQ